MTAARVLTTSDRGEVGRGSRKLPWLGLDIEGPVCLMSTELGTTVITTGTRIEGPPPSTTVSEKRFVQQ